VPGVRRQSCLADAPCLRCPRSDSDTRRPEALLRLPPVPCSYPLTGQNKL
jgi:hypothetical protein